MVRSFQIDVQMQGNSDMANITEQAGQLVGMSGIRSGLVTLFVVGSTAALTTIEYEPGLVNHDLPAMFEQIAPADGHYEHEMTWQDDNGHSHLRASLLGPSLTIPFVEGRLTLGTWQQIVLIDFDTRPRKRVVVAQVLGE